MTFVDVTDTRTGAHGRVPERWVGHPVLGRTLVRGHVSLPAPDAAVPAPTETLVDAPVVEPSPPGPGRGKPKAPRAGDHEED
jgi:hypothetical protein